MTVEFGGFKISQDGLTPSQSIIDAIEHFPKPANTTDARLWFGLVNQLAYNLSMSAMMHPFRELLKPGQWYCDEALDSAFKNSKTEIVNMIKDGVHSFELNRPTCLATDWSKKGLGFTLRQKHCKCTIVDHVRNVSHNCTKVHSNLFPSSHVRTRLWPGQGIAIAVKCHFELQAISIAS